MRKQKKNIVIVFDLGWEKAYLSRVTTSNGETHFERSKENEYGSHEFKTAAAFVQSVERYWERYGAPQKVILGGDHIEGYQAETLTEFICYEVLK